MTTTTARLGLIKPTDADDFVTEDIAANWQAIDDMVAGWLPAAPLADRPSPSAARAGFLFWAYDVGQAYLCAKDGAGTYAWRPTGVMRHADLDNLDAPDAHPQYLLKTDHAAVDHDAMGIDAETLTGIPLAEMGEHELFVMRHALTATTTEMSTSYKNVLSAGLNTADKWNTCRVSAYGVAIFNGHHTSASVQARIQIEGNNGPATNMSTGITDTPAMAAHTVGGLTNPVGTVAVRFQAKDANTSSPGDIESVSMFMLATRES